MKSFKKRKLRKRIPDKFWVTWRHLIFILFLLIFLVSVIYIKPSNSNNLTEKEYTESTPTPSPIITIAPLPDNPSDIMIDMIWYRNKHPYLFRYEGALRYPINNNEVKPTDIPTKEEDNILDNDGPEAEWVDLYPEIPLENEVEFYIYEKCKEYGLKFQMVLGLIYAESEFNHRCRDNKNTNGTYDVGLFQINSNNFEWMERVFGKKWDEYMLYDNIDAGLYILNYAQSVTDNEHGMLMVYNMGETGAKNKWAEGVLTTPYSRKVMEFADNLPKIEYDEVKNE